MQLERLRHAHAEFFSEFESALRQHQLGETAAASQALSLALRTLSLRTRSWADQASQSVADCASETSSSTAKQLKDLVTLSREFRTRLG